MSATDLLTPGAAALVKELEFFARTRVEGFLKSNNHSKRKGQSTEFMQHRQYMPGDDLRSLDWRVFARSDRLVTREYEEYTNLDVVIGLDASGSMGYGTLELNKIEFCRRCAAMICYLLMGQRDAFGLTILRDRVARYLRPQSSRKHLVEVLRQLVEAQPTGLTDFAVGVEQLLNQVRRRSVFIFFSDCYQDPDPLMRALGMLAVRGHDVVLYQVYDPAEAELPFAGFTLFRDLEGEGLDAVDPLEIRRAYRDVFAEHTLRIKEGTSRFGTEFHSIPVSVAWDEVLAGLLRERLRLR